MFHEDKFIKRCDQVMAFSFYIMILFLPMASAIIESFFGVLMIAFVSKRTRLYYLRSKSSLDPASPSLLKKLRDIVLAYKPTKTSLNLPLAIFAVIAVASIVMNDYWAEGWKGFFFKLFESLFLYFLFMETMRTRKRQTGFLLIFIGSAAFILIDGVFQYFTRVDFVFQHPITDGRVTSAFEHSNDLGCYLLVVTPVLLCLALQFRLTPQPQTKLLIPLERMLSHPLARAAFFLIFIMALIILGLTYSRSVWLSFILALVFVGIKRPKVLAVFLVLVIIFLVIFIPKMLKERESNFAGHELSDLFTTSSRLIYWDEALRIIKDHPWLGVGLNAYSQVAPGYVTHPHGSGGYPHNCYLQTAAEVGIPGLMVFLWMLGRLMKGALVFIKRSTHLFDQNLMLGLSAGFIGYLGHSFFDTCFYNVKLNALMWITMGFIAAVAQYRLPESSEDIL